MKKLFFLLFLLSAINVLAQQNPVINDPDVKKRTINESFTGISVSDGIDLYLSQGNTTSLAVSASDEKFLPRFKTEVENGMLKIFYDNNGINWSGNEKRKLKAYVSFKSLEKLQASGGAEVTIMGTLEVTDIEMKFTSGSTLGGKIKANELTIEQNSGSNINISGNAVTLKIDAGSGAVFKGYDLSVEYCFAKASSGAGVKITINKELNAKANSGGGIKYKGDAVIKEINVNSGGSVKKD